MPILRHRRHFENVVSGFSFNFWLVAVGLSQTLAGTTSSSESNQSCLSRTILSDPSLREVKSSAIIYLWSVESISAMSQLLFLLAWLHANLAEPPEGAYYLYI